LVIVVVQADVVKAYLGHEDALFTKKITFYKKTILWYNTVAASGGLGMFHRDEGEVAS